MHRKIIKSTRHKKIKAVDPFYRGERKHINDRSFKRANQKPKDANIQEVPRKLRELIKVQELIKEGKFKRSTHKGKGATNSYIGEDSGTDGKVPVFKKRQHESDKAFARRVKRITEAIVSGSKTQTKFDTEFDANNDESDDSELDESIGDLKSPAEKKKPKCEKKLAKRKIFQEKEKEKKRLKVEEGHLDREENLKEYVPFGEVAMHPPSLTFAPRKASKQNSSERKPGAKPLLLNKLFESKKSTSSSASELPAKTDLTGKRKHLAAADRRILEQEREAAVNAYRQMKKDKSSN